MSNLFNGDTPQIDPNKSYLSELVGEGKKYRDLAALALSKVHADQLIETQKAALEKAQQELQTQKRLEELLTTATNKVVDPVPNLVNPDPVREERMNDLTAEKVQQLISEQLNQHERNRQAQTNVQQVYSTLTETFGSDYENQLLKLGQSVGLSKEEIQQTAQDRPQLLISLIKANAPKRESFVAPPSNRLNPDIAPQSEVRNLAYYQKLKAKDLKYYESKEVQAQMYEDAMRLRDQF